MAEPYAQFQYCWTRSPKMRQLVKGGVSAPAITLMRAWEWAVAEYGSPTVELGDLEDACDWDGEPGVLVDLLQKTGHLDGDTFVLWWDDAVQPMLDARKKWADRKARQREKRKMSHGTSPGRPGSVTGTSGGQPRDVTGESHPKSRVKERRGEETTPTSASVADAPRVVAGWRDEVSSLMGSDAPAVITIVERVADARGFGTDPLIVWQDGRTVIKAAGGLPHFGYALTQFKKKLDDGSAKTYGGAPWGWLRSVAGNGPMNQQQQRKAPVPYQHETNKRQRLTSKPPVDLPPGEYYDVGKSTW